MTIFINKYVDRVTDRSSTTKTGSWYMVGKEPKLVERGYSTLEVLGRCGAGLVPVRWSVNDSVISLQLRDGGGL